MPLQDLLRGHDVVVWSAVPVGQPQRTYAVDRDAAIRSMDAAAAAEPRGYLMVFKPPVPGLTTVCPPTIPSTRTPRRRPRRRAHLRDSDLAWTILAPSGLTNDPAPEASMSTPDQPATVARADVATVIAAVVDHSDLGGRTIEFNNGPTPIRQALDAIAAG